MLLLSFRHCLAMPQTLRYLRALLTQLKSVLENRFEAKFMFHPFIVL